MAKKFIELIEAAALIILTAACVIGVMKHLDSHKDEPTEETPIVEETPEVLSLTISYEVEDITIEFEEGMTWLQWILSDYNQYCVTIGGEGYGNTYIHLYECGLESSSGLVSYNDVINPNETYIFSL